MQPVLGPMAEDQQSVVALPEALLFNQGTPLNRTDDVRRYFSDCYCVIYSAAGGVYPSWTGASLWSNLLIYLFAVGGFSFPVLFGMWPVAVIYALFIILTRK